MEEACLEFNVVLSIFSFLEVSSILRVSCLVCKQWNLVSQEPLVCYPFLSLLRLYKCADAISFGADLLKGLRHHRKHRGKGVEGTMATTATSNI